jgi:hypothetical protein
MLKSRYSPFQLAVLSSLYRLEQRQRLILDGISELLHDGPNDPELNQKLAALAHQLDVAGESLKAAVQANQPEPLQP